MASEPVLAGAGSRYRAERRYWQRVDSQSTSWFPWGALLLLGLLLTYIWGLLRTAPDIEANTREGVASTLQLLGNTPVAVEADGQGVTVVAEASIADADLIRRIAKSAECETWAGSLTCPTVVDLNLNQPTPLQTARQHNFEFAVSGNAITLRGEVPNEETRRSMVRQASTRFDPVRDQLTVSGAMATVDYDTAFIRSLSVLNRLNDGTVSWDNGVLNATGNASAAEEEAIRAAFNSRESAPPLGVLDLQITNEQVATEVDQCNEAFRSTLRSSTITFGTASAAIGPGSNALLGRLADLAKQCPGSLIIEGHTDNVGREVFNQTLSLNRAAAVRDALVAAGVGSDRLEAQGFGSSQPVANNDSESGRATNRRIVIRIAE